MEGGQRSPQFCAFVDLLGATVTDISIENTATLRLIFADGRQLVLFDASQQYESFQIDDLIV